MSSKRILTEAGKMVLAAACLLIAIALYVVAVP